MNVLDLFSGIGGFSLGLERAGMRTVAFCEIDPFCRRVLAKHWPDVPCYDDVRTLTHDRLRADGIAVDVIAGGFPCQDISIGGRGAGIEGERSGLWREYHRLICEIRPRFALVENVGALAFRGLERVLSDLTASGYDAEWDIISASHIGAPHARERLWIIAYPECPRLEGYFTIWRGVCGIAREISAEFGDQIIPCGPNWPRLSTYLRMGNGISRPLDELTALGNAVVPQIPEIIGRAIMSVERDAYDGNDDFSRSIEEAYAVIRERKAAGGKGWEPP